MKNVTTMLSTLILLSATLISPNTQVSAAGSCSNVGPWQANSATIFSPAAFATMTGDGSGNPQKLLQAIRGNDNRLYTRTTTQLATSESNWTAWQEGSGITIKTEPEVISFQTTSGSPMFVISAYGTDNGLYTRTSADGLTWAAWTRGGAITLKSKPTISSLQTYNASTMAFEQQLVQTGHGSDNGLYTRRSLNGTTWTDWVRGGSITLASRTEQLEFSGKIFQFARGTDNGLYSRYTSDGLTWTAWTRNSGGITVLDETSTVIAKDTDSNGTSVSGKILQYVRGTDSGIYFRSSTDAIDWSSWYRLGSITAADKPTSTVSINLGCGTNYVTRVYVKGINNRLYSVENGSSTSPTFGFDSGLNWSLDTGITLSNNISAIEHTPSTNPNVISGSIQSARGSDNKLYTRIISPTIVG